MVPRSCPANGGSLTLIRPRRVLRLNTPVPLMSSGLAPGAFGFVDAVNAMRAVVPLVVLADAAASRALGGAPFRPQPPATSVGRPIRAMGRPLAVAYDP